MKIGETIKLKDLDFKRPGTGLNPSDVRKIINKKLKRNIKKDHLFKISDVK